MREWSGTVPVQISTAQLVEASMRMRRTPPSCLDRVQEDPKITPWWQPPVPSTRAPDVSDTVTVPGPMHVMRKVIFIPGLVAPIRKSAGPVPFSRATRVPVGPMSCGAGDDGAGDALGEALADPTCVDSDPDGLTDAADRVDELTGTVFVDVEDQPAEP